MKKKPMKPMKVPETKKLVTPTSTDCTVETENMVETNCSCEENCGCETDCLSEEVINGECSVDETCTAETECGVENVCSVTTEIIIQHQGKDFTQGQMIDAVKAAWTENDIQEDIKTMTLYVKPEDGKIYYVINDIHTGDVDI